MNKSVIVYGPQGCGKTLHAERIRKHFGLDRFIDEWVGDRKLYERAAFVNEGTLYLTTLTPAEIQESWGVARAGRLLSFAEVAKQINDAIPLTGWINCYRVGQPARPGWYDVNYNADAPDYVAFEKRRYWTGSWWAADSNGWPFAPSGVFFGNKSGTEYHGEAWRGLTEEPIVIGGAA